MAGVVLGVVVGWVSAPGAVPRAAAYEASHTLILVPRSGNDYEVKRLNEVLATLGPVPDRVAARLKLAPRQVRAMVTAQARSPGLLVITGRSADPAQAQALANVTAEELIVELGGSNSPVQTLEPAVAKPAPTKDIKGPTSRPGRALLLGAFGLMLGIGGAFAVDRFDNRIRTKGSAEAALGVPVMAEVPPILRADRGRLLRGAEPSPYVEAYRGLRTMVARWASTTLNGAGHPVIVVTSATGGEGTTSTVAHLAAALAEVGQSVVAVSADLRRPRLQLYFDRPREPGLTDVLRGAPDVRHLTDLNLTTAIQGVRFVASGAPVRNPAPLIDHLAAHLEAARDLGDFVLVDAPPLLTASEAADLAHAADAVLLVVRAGRTSVGAAARSVELLDRLGVPVLGVVLVGGAGGPART